MKSERLGQSGLAQDRIGGVAARNADRHRKFRPVIGLRQISWLPLPCRTSEQPALRSTRASTVKLRRHSRREWFGFAQLSDLKEEVGGIHTGMVVGQEVERHR